MSVYDIGRVCVKTTGREAGRYCVVVDIIDKNYV
ncbi:MAG: KOW motif-containing protein, partial [Promethearchaeota archaeon]